MASIAEILLHQGRSLGDARRQSGQRSAQLAQNLAGIASDTISGYFQQKQDKPYRDAQIAAIQARTAEDQAQTTERTQQREDRSVLQSAMSSGMDPAQVESQLQTLGRGDMVSAFRATRLKDDTVVAQTKILREELKELEGKQLQRMARRVRPFLSEPDGGMGTAHAAVQELVEDGFDPKQADDIWQQIAKNPQALPRVIDALDPQEAKVPQLTQVDPTKDLYTDGQLTRPGVAPPVEERPDARGLEVQLSDAKERGDRGRVAAIEYAMRRREQLGRAPVTGSADPGPLETVVGADGVTRYTTRRDAVGQRPGSGTEKASSGAQKRVLNFFNRARQADEELESMEPQIQALGGADQTRMKYAPNWAQSQLGQSYTASQRAFTEARLRKDSGAAIPTQEFENDQQTYFAQPFDSPETLELKRRARATILSSLAFESGQALGEFVGDPDEAKAIIEGYKARSVKPAQKVPSAAPAAKAPAAGGWVEIAPGVRVREKR